MARVGSQRHRKKKMHVYLYYKIETFVPEVVLNAEAFLAITTECFSAL